MLHKFKATYWQTRYYLLKVITKKSTEVTIELIQQLEYFVDMHGDVSYISVEEKKEDPDVVQANQVIQRARRIHNV